MKGVIRINVISVILFLSSFTGFSWGVTAAPKPCCYPSVFTFGVADISLTYQPTSIGTELVSEEGFFYGNKTLNKYAQNVTVRSLVQTQPSQQVFIIEDFDKGYEYIIVDNKQCSRIPLGGKPSECIPANATYLGGVNLGEKFPVDRWSFSSGIVMEELAVTPDKCIPVTYNLLKNSGNNTFTSTTYEYFNFTSSIPANIFTPPSFCPKDDDSTTNQIPDNLERTLAHIRRLFPRQKN